MTDFIRTPDVNFIDLASFPYEPNYHLWQDLRVHYVDEGPPDRPVMLLLHGMPTWSFLCRDVIPGLLAVGYRCIAPAHLGFGRSDKPTDPHWYTIARHTEVLTTLITGIDLTDVTLVCQDWGGPIGLAQAVTMPERFSRLVIMSTWLHHEGYQYTEGIRSWNRNWHEGGLFDGNVRMLPCCSSSLRDWQALRSFFPRWSMAQRQDSQEGLLTNTGDSLRLLLVSPMPRSTGFEGSRSRYRWTATTTGTGRRRTTTTTNCSRGTSPSISSGDVRI